MVSSIHSPTQSQPIWLKPQYLELFISLAMLPLLVGLLAHQQLFKCALSLGGLCESIFQGITLPFIDLPD